MNKEQMKPKIVVLCGSSRFTDVMAVCAWLIEKNEHAITMGLHLLPEWYFVNNGFVADHLAENEGVANEMDELHLRKIDMSDEIFVVDVNEYVGDSTLREIKYARERGKNIRLFSEDKIGNLVIDIIFSKKEE